MNSRYSALLALLLGGCTLAPHYPRPSATVPQELPFADPEQPTAILQDVDELYTEARLRQVLELALEHNLDLKIAALNAEQVRAYYRIERANLLPAVNAIGAGSKHRSPADLSSSAGWDTAESSLRARESAWGQLPGTAASGRV